MLQRVKTAASTALGSHDVVSDLSLIHVLQKHSLLWREQKPTDMYVEKYNQNVDTACLYILNWNCLSEWNRDKVILYNGILVNNPNNDP